MKSGHLWLRALIIFVVFTTIFLWKPLSTGGWYGAGDVSGLSPVVASEDAERGRLPQIDVTVDILPWTEFNRDEIRAGRLPSWNPYNGSGVPHVGNIQAAVFSPFQAPFYVLPMRWALLVSAYLTLLTAGMLTYGLLRHLRASHVASVAAGVVYMFSGFMVFWLRWPLADVAAFAPGLLWATSSLLRAETRRSVIRRGVALGVLVALSVFAGHPETMFFCVLPSVLWGVAWTVRRRAGLVDAVRRFSRLVVASLSGLVLSAVQLLPFLQYLDRSAAIEGRQVHVFHTLKWTASHAFPLAAGSPAMAYRGPYNIHLVFHEIAMLYLGTFALVLGAVAVLSYWWNRSYVLAFFILLSAGTLLFVYDPAGISSWLTGLPLLSLLMPSRIAIVWVLGTAVLAGFGVDALFRSPRAVLAARRRAFVVLGVAVAGGVGLLVHRAWRLRHYDVFSSAEARALSWRTLTDHVGFILVTLVLGVVCAVAGVWQRERRWRATLASGLVVVLFLQSGFLLRGQNVTVPEERFRNFDDRVFQLAEVLGENQTLWTARARLMPDVNLWIPAYSPDNYDVIGIRTYEALFRKTLGAPEKLEVGGVVLGLLAGPYDPPSTEALQTLGIRRVVSPRSYPFIDDVFAGLPEPELPHGRSRFWFGWLGDVPHVLVVTTQGLPDGAVLEAVLDGEAVDAPVEEGIVIENGLGLLVLPADMKPDRSLAVAFDHPVVASEDPGAVGVRHAKMLVTSVPGLELQTSVDGYQIFTVPGPSGFASAPPLTSYAADATEAFARVTSADFDPLEEVVIVSEEPDPAPVVGDPPTPGRVVTAQPRPDHFRVNVQRDEPGYVVLNQNHFPGWRATVNGTDTPIVRANSTFMAVAVPAGASEVVFRFESGAIRWGAIISSGTSVLMLLALVAATWRRKRDG